MDEWQLFSGVLSLALVAYLSWHYWTYGGFSRKYFTVYPIVGMLPDVIWHYSHIFDTVAETLESCKNLCFLGAIPGTKWFFTANPVHVEHILKTNFHNYNKGQGFKEVLQELLGDSIFNSDGEHWRLQRKIASYEFSTGALRNCMLQAFQRESQERLIPLLDWAASTGAVIDMQDVLLRSNFDNICAVGFGTDPAALTRDFPEIPFAKALDRAAMTAVGRYVQPSLVWKTMRALQVGTERQLTQDLKIVHGFVQDVIDKRRAELSAAAAAGERKNGEGKHERSDILSGLISLGQSNHGQSFSDSFLRDASLGFLMAGRDTSASALTWLFWLLSRNPEVERKIREELQGIVQRRRSIPATESPDCKETREKTATPFSFEEMKGMVYTHAAINEAMRLYAPVPADQRNCLADDVLPDGTFIGKGWRVSYWIMPMGRMTKLWGPEAAEFKPERWIDEKGNLKTVSPFQFPVFNAGPQSCLGRDMAYLQMKSVVSTVLLNYSLTVVPGHKGEYSATLTLVMKGGLPVTVGRLP